MNNTWDQIVNTAENFLPQLLAALAILLVGLVAAWIGAKLTRMVLSRTTIDNRIAEKMRADDPAVKPVSVETLMSRIVFWGILIITLVGFFNALDLDSVAGPFGGFIQEVFAFLPNILSAGLLLLLAWIVARLVRFGIRKAARASRIDEKLSDSTHTEGKPVPLTNTIANAGYWLVLLIFLPVILDALSIRSITGPINDMIQRVLIAIPHLFAAALLIAIAYFVGKVIAGVLTSILTSLGFNRLFEPLANLHRQSSVSSAPETTTSTRTPAEIVGTVALIAIILFASVEALNVLEFDRIANLVSTFIVLLGQILMAILIFGISLYIARLVAEMIRASGTAQADLLSKAAKIGIVTLGVSMALRESGLAGDLVLTIVTLLVAAIAIAVAIAFGVGGRDVAKKYLEQWSSATETTPVTHSQRDDV